VRGGGRSRGGLGQPRTWPKSDVGGLAQSECASSTIVVPPSPGRPVDRGPPSPGCSSLLPPLSAVPGGRGGARESSLNRESPRTATLHPRGRLDAQTKLAGGVRIDLGEVETACRASPLCRHAVCRVIGSGRLVCFVEPASSTGALCSSNPPSAGQGAASEHSESSVTVASVRAACEQNLPRHAVPSAFHVISTWPRLVTGKIDKAKLDVVNSLGENESLGASPEGKGPDGGPDGAEKNKAVVVVVEKKDKMHHRQAHTSESRLNVEPGHCDTGETGFADTRVNPALIRNLAKVVAPSTFVCVFLASRIVGSCGLSASRAVMSEAIAIMWEAMFGCRSRVVLLFGARGLGFLPSLLVVDGSEFGNFFTESEEFDFVGNPTEAAVGAAPSSLDGHERGFLFDLLLRLILAPYIVYFAALVVKLATGTETGHILFREWVADWMWRNYLIRSCTTSESVASFLLRSSGVGRPHRGALESSSSTNSEYSESSEEEKVPETSWGGEDFGEEFSELFLLAPVYEVQRAERGFRLFMSQLKFAATYYLVPLFVVFADLRVLFLLWSLSFVHDVVLPVCCFPASELGRVWHVTSRPASWAACFPAQPVTTAVAAVVVRFCGAVFKSFVPAAKSDESALSRVSQLSGAEGDQGRRVVDGTERVVDGTRSADESCPMPQFFKLLAKAKAKNAPSFVYKGTTFTYKKKTNESSSSASRRGHTCSQGIMKQMKQLISRSTLRLVLYDVFRYAVRRPVGIAVLVYLGYRARVRARVRARGAHRANVRRVSLVIGTGTYFSNRARRCVGPRHDTAP